MLTRPQKKNIEFIKSRFDREASVYDLAGEFGFDIQLLDKDCGVGGLYLYRENTIGINEKYVGEEEDTWEVFVHEFGHLIHEMSEDSDFYGQYKRHNLLFSQLIKSEQQASLIGLEIWNWKFPEKKLGFIPYFKKEDILWLADYYESYFENDLHIYHKELTCQ